MVRSLIPNETKVLACTATATEAIYAEIVKILSMDNPHIVSLPPDRPNIMYSVKPKKPLDELADDICSKLKSVSSPLLFPKTIIFCRR